MRPLALYHDHGVDWTDDLAHPEARTLSTFAYRWKHYPSGQVGTRIIAVNGDPSRFLALIAAWNKVGAATGWEYSAML